MREDRDAELVVNREEPRLEEVYAGGPRGTEEVIARRTGGAVGDVIEDPLAVERTGEEIAHRAAER